MKAKYVVLAAVLILASGCKSNQSATTAAAPAPNQANQYPQGQLSQQGDLRTINQAGARPVSLFNFDTRLNQIVRDRSDIRVLEAGLRYDRNYNVFKIRLVTQDQAGSIPEVERITAMAQPYGRIGQSVYGSFGSLVSYQLVSGEVCADVTLNATPIRWYPTAFTVCGPVQGQAYDNSYDRNRR